MLNCPFIKSSFPSMQHAILPFQYATCLGRLYGILWLWLAWAQRPVPADPKLLWFTACKKTLWALPSRGYMFHRDKGKMSQAQGLSRSGRSEAESQTGETKYQRPKLKTTGYYPKAKSYALFRQQTCVSVFTNAMLKACCMIRVTTKLFRIVRSLSLDDRIHGFSLMLIPNGFHPSEYYICDRVSKFFQVGSCWSPRKSFSSRQHFSINCPILVLPI